MLRTVIGGAVVLLPIALVATRRHPDADRTPDPEARPRLILGAAMITLPALGLWHLWSARPIRPRVAGMPAGSSVMCWADR